MYCLHTHSTGSLRSSTPSAAQYDVMFVRVHQRVCAPRLCGLRRRWCYEIYMYIYTHDRCLTALLCPEIRLDRLIVCATRRVIRLYSLKSLSYAIPSRNESADFSIFPSALNTSRDPFSRLTSLAESGVP